MLLRQLQGGAKLGLPHSRPMPGIGARCHELRIVDEGATWRIILRLDEDAIVIADVFSKSDRRRLQQEDPSDARAGDRGLPTPTAPVRRATAIVRLIRTEHGQARTRKTQGRGLDCRAASRVSRAFRRRGRLCGVQARSEQCAAVVAHHPGIVAGRRCKTPAIQSIARCQDGGFGRQRIRRPSRAVAVQARSATGRHCESHSTTPEGGGLTSPTRPGWRSGRTVRTARSLRSNRPPIARLRIEWVCSRHSTRWATPGATLTAVEPQSTFAPDSRTIFDHLAMSALRIAANCSGVVS